MSAYDLIELFCELIAARLPIIESQKMCPYDLKEAISIVIFASPRCADIPELKDIQKHFTAKYGKEFVSSALEVQPDCGVSRLVVEKLSSKAPDVENKIKILTSIAQEHNVNWNSKAYDGQLKKPNDDLLRCKCRDMMTYGKLWLANGFMCVELRVFFGLGEFADLLCRAWSQEINSMW